MINLYNYSLEKLEELMLSLQEKKYRATQLFKWIYEKRVTSFDEMSDVSKSFREVLNRDYIKNKEAKMALSNFFLN